MTHEGDTFSFNMTTRKATMFTRSRSNIGFHIYYDTFAQLENYRVPYKLLKNIIMQQKLYIANIIW